MDRLSISTELSRRCCSRTRNVWQNSYLVSPRASSKHSSRPLRNENTRSQVTFLFLSRAFFTFMDRIFSSDYNYVGDYVNDDDSHDFKRARGFNYHNGPEWLWLTGYYIRAKLYWCKQQDNPLLVKQTIRHVRQLFSSLLELLSSNPWKGLPELTNANGQPCSHSCSVQAWSAATLLEAFYDLIRA